MSTTVIRMAHHRRTGWHEVMHWLHEPVSLGRTHYRLGRGWRWLRHVHLIPGRLIQWSCDRYDRRLGLSETEIRRYRPTA